MAYKVIILYQLYMPSCFLGTFTEYPYSVDGIRSSEIYWDIRETGRIIDCFILMIIPGKMDFRIQNSYDIFIRFGK